MYLLMSKNFRKADPSEFGDYCFGGAESLKDIEALLPEVIETYGKEACDLEILEAYSIYCNIKEKPREFTFEA